MSFLHLSLIAGLAVITVPIMLHMFGQKQPQLIDFPALRFVRETRQEQSSSWQLRHFLLLLLRILLLAALAFALARPRVHSAMLGSILGITTVGGFAALASLIAAVALVTKRPASIWMTCAVIALALWAATALWAVQSLSTGPSVPSSDSSAPIAAVLVVDNGPTMAYKSGNELRLESAKTMANWILEQLPLDSRVAILSDAPVGVLALDPSTAKTQVQIIETRGARVDLLQRIRTGMDLVIANELERKEVYVITDLMSSSWNDASTELKEMLAEYREEVLVQIIDVGGEATLNYQLGDIQSDFNTIPAGGDVTLTVPIRRIETASSSKNSLSVELWQEAIDPRLPVVVNGELQTAPAKVVDRKVVDLNSSATASIELAARGLAAGTHHFTVRIDQADPLMIDNERFTSIVAREPQPTLIVADDPGLGEMLRLIVDPTGSRGAADNLPMVEDVRFAQLPQVALEKYEVICLFDPPPLSSKVAQSLKEHVLGGGGLMTILGSGLGTADQVQGNAIADLLPGKLANVTRRERSDRNIFLDPVAITHPAFGELATVSEDVPWNIFPVFANWTFSSLVDNAVVLMNLSDGSTPVMIAHSLGRGQIITLATPIPEVEVRGRALWNELWVGGDPWPAYALLLGTFRTLSGADQAKANFQAEELVSLSNDPFTWPSRYELFTPNAQTRRVDAAEGVLSLGKFPQPGTYHLRGQRETAVSRGFSVNVPADDTQLIRLTQTELDERLGEGHYRLAQNKDEVESSVGQARFGRELYPLMMVFVAGLFLAEQAMSNRFYKIKFSRAQGT